MIPQLYGSLDGFVHRSIDRIGRRLDERGQHMRARVGHDTVAATAFSYAFALVAPVDVSAFQQAVGYPAMFVSMNLELALSRRECNLPYTQPSDLVARSENAMRTIRLPLGLIGAGYLSYGAIGAIHGIATGSLSLDDLHNVSLGAFVAAPAFSSYLRDRDPPAYEPLEAYVREPTTVAAE